MPVPLLSFVPLRIAQVPKGLPGYVGGTFFPLVGSTGGTLGLAVLVRCPMLCAGNLIATQPCISVPGYHRGLCSS